MDCIFASISSCVRSFAGVLVCIGEGEEVDFSGIARFALSALPNLEK
jgi:hypothetical protein